MNFSRQSPLGGLIIVMVVTFFCPSKGLAAAFTATTAGNWNVGATWGNSGNNVEGSGFPGSGDTATISASAGLSVTVNIATAKCSAVTLGQNGNKDGTLAFSSGSQLTVSGNITLGNGNGKGSLDMSGGGTL